jgi:hypothetical protein
MKGSAPIRHSGHEHVQVTLCNQRAADRLHGGTGSSGHVEGCTSFEILHGEYDAGHRVDDVMTQLRQTTAGSDVQHSPLILINQAHELAPAHIHHFYAQAFHIFASTPRSAMEGSHAVAVAHAQQRLPSNFKHLGSSLFEDANNSPGKSTPTIARRQQD